MQATTLEFGIVNAPIQRYHPTLVAQAAATLGEVFPQRFFGYPLEADRLNEQITGTGWPAKDIRNARFEESVNIIRRLWNGELFISFMESKVLPFL